MSSSWLGLRWPWVLLAALVVGAAVVYTGPLPIAFDIVTRPEITGVHYYWRPAGLIGVFADNPWVYAVAIDADGNGKVVASTWADTPCDGVSRLSRRLLLPAPQCAD